MLCYVFLKEESKRGGGGGGEGGEGDLWWSVFV